MKTCGQCKLEKEDSEFNVRKLKKGYGLKSSCKQCKAINNKKWREASPEVIQAWQALNADKRKIWRKNWADANKEKRKERNRKWIENNFEKNAALKRAYNKRNPEKMCFHTNKRRARKLQAQPLWANEFFIQEAYALAKLRTKMFGFAWHVDHIVPLQNNLVCGLHCEFNLQVIPAAENHKKHNTFEIT